jgi:hypothetical protein
MRPEDLGEHLRIRVVADQADRTDAENPGRLDGDRREYCLRFGALCHQRRDPPQRAKHIRHFISGP